MTTLIILGSQAIARFRIAASSDHALIFLHDGRATLSFSPDDAKALGKALIAVASGTHDIAETQLSIDLREEDSARRRRAQQEARERAPEPKISADYASLFGGEE